MTIALEMTGVYNQPMECQQQVLEISGMSHFMLYIFIGIDYGFQVNVQIQI